MASNFCCPVITGSLSSRGLLWRWWSLPSIWWAIICAIFLIRATRSRGATMTEYATLADRSEQAQASSGDLLLDVQGLKTWFHTRDGVVKAVDGVSLQLSHGEILGLVGESGSRLEDRGVGKGGVSTFRTRCWP